MPRHLRKTGPAQRPTAAPVSLPALSGAALQTQPVVCSCPGRPRRLQAEAAEAEAAREAAAAAALARDRAAVRQLRMTLRGVAMKLLGDRRWAACALPVDPEENPEFYARVRASAGTLLAAHARVTHAALHVLSGSRSTLGFGH